MSQIDIPKNWKLVTVEDLSEIITKGSTPTTYGHNYTESGIPFLRAENVSDNHLNFNNLKYISRETHNFLKRSIIKPNDVLLTIAGSIGRTAVVPIESKEMNANQAVSIIRLNHNCLPEYLSYFLNSNLAKQQIIGSQVITSIPNLSLSMIAKLSLPLPPKDIQKKIVQKLDYIFGEIEKRKKMIIPLQEINKLKILSYTTYQNVLKLALSGKLTKQNNEESNTLDRMSKKTTIHTSNSNGTKFKDLPKLPNGWEWITMDEVTDLITDGDHLTPPRLDDGKPMLSAKNIRDGFIDWENIQYVSDSDFQKSLKRCNPTKGDVLMVCVGATIGRAAIVETDEPFMLVRSVALLRPSNKIYPHYLLAVINYSETQKHMLNNRNISAQPGLYLSQIKKIPVPLPPLKEQEHIVEKLRNYKEKIDIINNDVIKKIIENRIRLVKHYDYLTDQILNSAFSGKLVN